MHILHAIGCNKPYMAKSLVRSHGADRVALDQHITFCQQLNGFERRSIWAYESLAPFDETFLAARDVTNFDDITRYAILENLGGLGKRNAARQQLDKITR